MVEELISRQALEAELTAELRFAELKGDNKTAKAYRRCLTLLAEAKAMGYVNPTQFVFYGANRE